jgi:hypothetical protein
MPISDLYDRKEGYGHTAGTSTLKDDSNWTAAITPPSFGTDSLATRLGKLIATPNAASRRVGRATQQGALYDRSSGYGHTAGDPDDSMSANLANNSNALAYSGSNTALDNTSSEADATNRTADAMNSTERASTGFRDRTTGWGHTAGTLTDLND